ncbi:hypothetical protein [Streptacidiphilus neutrinimicus]|uniref:hypothetical protein n=1 Tax=Streptacidiphilus neutrinimicus TaxID=105420 RepID=UPI0005AB7B33|nr:hypothetical protein [Streptacidiphilus neutrinimicus]
MAVAASTASGAPPARPAPDHAVDRALWERLRRAAYRGHLLPEGFAVLDELHDRYPEWREEW